MRLRRKVRSAGRPSLAKTGLALFSISCLLAVAALLGPVVTAETQSAPAVTVTVIADGQEWEWVSTESTVGDLLRVAGVVLEGKDRAEPKLDTKPRSGMKIRVTRVRDRIVLQREPINFKTVTKLDPNIKAGRKVVQAGRRGEKEIKYLVTYKDGVKAGYRVLDAKVLKQPVNEVVAVPIPLRGNLSSRSGARVRSIRMEATAYAPFHCGGSPSGRTATGIKARKGVAAVDPRVIPLGTQLYVEGYGACVAADTGGAIKGNRIDLCFNTYGEAIRFGRRNVTVHILK